MCGKYSSSSSMSNHLQGSPPRVWEVRINEYDERKTLGITPTCVGSTRVLKLGSLVPKDHPHVCGKYKLLNLLNSFSLGSPPRVWEVHKVKR